MEFNYTAEQDLLKKAARAFLEKECPSALVREMENDARGYQGALWTRMAALQWMGLAFPEEYGGAGGSFLDLTVLLEEMGRVQLPSPFIPTVICAGLPLLAAGTEQQKRTFLPKIADGSMVLSAALMEPDSTYHASGINVQAVLDGGDYVISGTKLCVAYAEAADYLLCAVRTQDTGDSEQGVTLFLVPGKSSGITYTPLQNIASDKLPEVAFDSVRVPVDSIVGKLHIGWPVLHSMLQMAAIAQCAFMVGAADRVLEMTTKHATERVQYDHPIGSFQAIQHRCADMLTDSLTAKYITYKVAAQLSAGNECAKEVSIAKAWVGEAYRRVCSNGSHVHGGYGLMLEHDMQLFFRRQKVSELLFGDGDFHRGIVAQQLGLSAAAANR